MILMLTLLGACSSTRLSYQFADRGAVWWVEDYVDLTGEQEDALRGDLRRLRDWHCETQLPRYSDWLEELHQESASTELPPARITHHREQVAVFLEPLTDRIIPIASRLLQSLSDEQVEELVAGREGATEAWLEGRERWQAAFFEVLAERQQPDFENQLQELILNYEQYQGEGHQARAGQNAEDIVQLTHRLLVAAEERHWQHLQDETNDLRQDVVALACAT